LCNRRKGKKPRPSHHSDKRGRKGKRPSTITSIIGKKRGLLVFVTEEGGGGGEKGSNLKNILYRKREGCGKGVSGAMRKGLSREKRVQVFTKTKKKKFRGEVGKTVTSRRKTTSCPQRTLPERICAPESGGL